MGSSVAEEGPSQRRPPGLGGWVGALVLIGGLVGALILLVAEFTTLFAVQTPSGTIHSEGTGSHHAFAMALIAIVAGWLAVGAWRAGSRPALLALGALGVLALLISLLGDLPDAQAHGLVRAGAHLELASAKPSAGLYMDTLGGALLLISSVSAFILIGPPPPARERPAARDE